MKRSVNPKLLLAALLFLAAVTSVVGIFQLSERQHLLKNGFETAGVVTNIDVGVKGMRSVEASFATREGQLVVGRDIHRTQWSNANEIGDQVTLHYNPREPEQILIARGLWIWSNPAFLLAGGIFLCGLGVLVYRQPTA